MTKKGCLFCEAHLKNIFKNVKGEVLPYIKEITETDGAAIVRLQGDIDSLTLPTIMSNCCHAKQRQAINKNLILDLKDVTHIDSATLAAFVLLLNDIKEKGKQLGIINMPAMLQRYLDVSKLAQYFTVYENESVALSVLK